MLHTIDNARSELEAALAGLERQSSDGAGLADGEARTRLRSLAKLRDQLVAGRDGTPPASLRAEVTAAVAAIHAYASDARGASSSQGAQKDAELALLHAEARAGVMSAATDIFERRIFDPYLRFDSERDEEEYRKREAERRAEIEHLLALDTPEATLQANRLLVEQARDAKDHGVPDHIVDPIVDQLASGGDALGAALRTSESQMEREQAVQQHTTPELPPELLALMAASGIAMPDQNGRGHGLGIDQIPPARSEGRA